MANPQRPAGTAQVIVIGDKQYTMTFSVRAMAALQDHYGLKSLTEVGEKMRAMKDASIEDMVVLFWASLQRHHSEVTLDAAWELADEAGAQNLTQAIVKAVAASTPDSVRGKGGTGAPARPMRGR